MFSGAHFHLLVNHAPVMAAFFALVLLLASYIWSPDVLRRTALVTLVGMALAGAAAYYSGDPAAHAVRGLPGVTRAAVHAHSSFADLTIIAAGVVGVIALILLIRTRNGPVSSTVAAIALVCTLAATALVSYTALLGGRIRHSEVRPGATTADAMVVDSFPPRPAK